MNLIVFSTIPILISVFWSLVLFSTGYWKKDKNKSFFAVIIAILSLIYTGHAVFFYGDHSVYLMWESIHLFSALFIFPMFFVYTKRIMGNPRLSMGDLMLFLPAFVFLFSSLILYCLMPEIDKNTYFEQILHKKNTQFIGWTNVLYLQKIKINTYPVILILVALASVIHIRKMLEDYKKSNLYLIQIDIIKKVTYLQSLLLTLVLAATTFAVINKIVMHNSSVFVVLYSALFGIITFSIGVFAYKQSEIREGGKIKTEYVINKRMPSEDVYKHVLEGSVGQESEQNMVMLILKEKILKLMEEDMIFQKNDLSLNDLAVMLNSNRSYVSKVINTLMDTTFDNLVGGYRVEFAKQLLSSGVKHELLIDDIIKQAGFTSKSSFYRIFKQKTGVTPNQYRSAAMRL